MKEEKKSNEPVEKTQLEQYEDASLSKRDDTLAETFISIHLRYDFMVAVLCGVALAISMITGGAPKLSLIMWAFGLSVVLIGHHVSVASFEAAIKNLYTDEGKRGKYDYLLMYIMNPLQGLLFVVGLLACVFSKGA